MDWILALWNEIFRRDDIQVTDDFFEIGGYSILMIQIVTRIEESFGVRIPLREFFTAPTVERLATLVHAREATLGRNDAAVAPDNGDEAALAEILDEVEGLSDVEVDAVLGGDPEMCSDDGQDL